MELLKNYLEAILPIPLLHAQWLNTLSYLENAGARKIAKYEHPTKVKEEMLKHAAEEFRHAHHLKREIKKLSSGFNFDDYQLDSLWGGLKTIRYLDRLEILISRKLKKEVSSPYRALEVYPLYQNLLKQRRFNIHIQSILLEERGHLKEISDEISRFDILKSFVPWIHEVEERYFLEWMSCMQKECTMKLVEFKEHTSL
jgi:hypothetical protein